MITGRTISSDLPPLPNRPVPAASNPYFRRPIPAFFFHQFSVAGADGEQDAASILVEYAATYGWNRQQQEKLVVEFWESIADDLLEDIDRYQWTTRFAEYLRSKGQKSGKRRVKVA